MAFAKELFRVVLPSRCIGKAMVAYTKPQQRKKEESERLEEIEMRSNLLILDSKDGKLQDSGKQEEGTTFHKLHVLEMNYIFLIQEDSISYNK